MGLQITFDKEVIPQAHFIVVKFTNTGNVSIKEPDYRVPISLSFGEKAKLLAWRPVNTKPEIAEFTRIKPDKTGKTTIDPIFSARERVQKRSARLHFSSKFEVRLFNHKSE